MSRLRLALALADGPLELSLTVDAGRLAAVEWSDGAPEEDEDTAAPEPIQGPWAAWLKAWSRGAPPAPDALPLMPAATPFQARLRSALLALPFGETRCYGELARSLNSSPRAVGQALARNPLPIVVPCHRVVAANGTGGFSGTAGGAAVAIKRRLLQHEGHHGLA